MHPSFSSAVVASSESRSPLDVDPASYSARTSYRRRSPSVAPSAPVPVPVRLYRRAVVPGQGAVRELVSLIVRVPQGR